MKIEILGTPFGRCVVVRDPWDNELVLLDTSKSLLESDSEGNVLGNTQPTWHHAFQGDKGNCYRQNLGRNHPLNNTFGV